VNAPNTSVSLRTAQRANNKLERSIPSSVIQENEAVESTPKVRSSKKEKDPVEMTPKERSSKVLQQTKERETKSIERKEKVL